MRVFILGLLCCFCLFCKGQTDEQKFSKGIESGLVVEQRNIGFCYELGKGVVKDLDKAFYWYSRAAQYKSILESNDLGISYIYGRGVSKDYATAVYLYLKSSKHGDHMAQNNLAWCYANGKGIPKDLNKAFYWFENSAKAGDILARTNLALFYELGKSVAINLEKSFYWYSKAAYKGEQYAQNKLGLCYELGKGVTKDIDKAISLYRKSAKQGNIEAKYNLAWCYMLGNGVPKDFIKAYELFKQSSESGNIAAQCCLGWCFEKGKGVIKDINRALYWYNKSAEKGFNLAISKRNDYKNLSYVEKKIKIQYKKWLKRGEFEKTKDYNLRVSRENRNKKLESLNKELIGVYKKIYIKTISKKFSLLAYDADNEVFELKQGDKSYYLSVPITDAKDFKENFEKVSFCDFDVNLDSNKKYVITNFTALYEGNEYVYDISKDVNFNDYASVDIDVDDIDLNISNSSINKGKLRRKKISKSLTLKKSEIDTNIPTTCKNNSNTYCLIIGNEDYSSRQRGLTKENNVPFAVNDAKVVKMYYNMTLGVPSENITLLTNATASEIYQQVDKLSKLAKVCDGDANLIFYYAGHGLPDTATKEQYLIPVDVNSENIKYGVKINDVIAKLTKYKANHVTVLLDACFSGGARNQGLLATRGVSIEPKSNIVKGNLVLMSSCSSSQSASAYDEKQHGMFTYYFLKKLNETEGNVTYEDLFDYVEKNVKLRSVLINNKEQSPKLNISPLVRNNWKSWKF